MTSKTHEAAIGRGGTPGREGQARAAEPAAQLEELLGKSKQQLVELAGELNLKRVSKLPKAELARKILAARQELQPARAPAPPPAAAPRPNLTRAEAESRPPPPVAPEVRAPAAEAASASPRTPASATSARPPPPASSAAPAAGAVPAERPSPAAAARLDLGPAAATGPREEHVPWSYGQDRITAMAVDPDTLYVYWEVTDPAMERARAALGGEGAGAWLDLRVYDISGLIFDGGNAHSYFDHGLGRSDRQWFFTIGKPSSSAIVEVGVRSPGGAFARIARSSRVDFPRSSAAPWSDPEWMTVLASGDVVPAGRGVPARPGAGAPPPPAGGPGGGGERFEHVPMGVLLEPGEGERRFRELFGDAFECLEWQEAHGEGWYELQGRLEWQVGPMVSSWAAGPFTYPVQVEPPSRATWEGGAIAYTADGVTRVVYGPWQVVIRNLFGRAESTVLGRWQIYRSWTTKGGLEEVQWMATRTAGAPGGASERTAASAWLWQAGSETRLGGASELWRLGASEVRLRGASEVMYTGGSERRLAGASERRLAGASEWRLAGASERRLAGASERRLGGASERRLGGSEGRLGGSEARLGGGGDSQPDGTGEGNMGGEPWPRRD